MTASPDPLAHRSRTSRRRQVALGTAAALVGALPTALAGASSAAATPIAATAPSGVATPSGVAAPAATPSGAAAPATAVAPTSPAAPTGPAPPTAPPPVSILTSQPGFGHGDIFITPTGDSSTYANGPEILDSHGNVVWFHAIPQGQTAADFRVQSLDGRPVLTWWQGTGLGGLSSGSDYIYNDHYHQVATVNAGNGLSADGHEFLITPQNTALILSYTTATANLTSIDGPADQTVINGVVQDIDIATGKVLFQWNSEDHVPFAQSEQPLPASPSTPWDWFHINAVKLDTDGNLLIDARDTWTTYKVNRFTGNIIWQLGGKDSSFTLQAAPGQVLDSAGEIFAWQHDPQALGGDEYTFFAKGHRARTRTAVGDSLSRVLAAARKREAATAWEVSLTSSKPLGTGSSVCAPQPKCT